MYKIKITISKIESTVDIHKKYSKQKHVNISPLEGKKSAECVGDLRAKKD